MNRLKWSNISRRFTGKPFKSNERHAKRDLAMSFHRWKAKHPKTTVLTSKMLHTWGEILMLVCSAIYHPRKLTFFFIILVKNDVSSFYFSPIVGILFCCGLMDTQVFNNAFVAFSSFVHLYNGISKVLWMYWLINFRGFWKKCVPLQSTLPSMSS